MNEMEPRVSERTLTQSLENIRESIKNIQNPFKQRMTNSSTTSFKPEIPFKDDKLFQVLGLIEDQEQSDSDPEIAPKRKSKNLVQFLGGPQIELPEKRKKWGMKLKEMLPNILVEMGEDTILTESVVDSTESLQDIQKEEHLPDLKSSCNDEKKVIEVTDTVDVCNETEQRKPDQEQLSPSSSNQSLELARKDLVKYLGATSPSSLSAQLQFKPTSIIKRNSKKLKKLLKDFPSVSQSLQMIQNQNISSKALALKAKQKFRKAMTFIQATKAFKEVVPVPIELQMETYEYKSVEEQLEQFRRDSLIKPVPMKGHSSNFKRPFFNVERDYRVIDFIRTDKSQWVELVGTIDSNETLDQQNDGDLDVFSPAFVAEMLHSYPIDPPPKKIVMDKKTIVKREPKMTIDISGIISTILHDVPFKREIFHDQLWQIPNQEAYPDLFGDESISSVGEDDDVHTSSFNIFSVHLVEDHHVEYEEHPLEIHRQRRWTTFEARESPSLPKSRSLFGLTQLQRLNKVIEEETRGLEQLRKLNAVLEQDSFVSDKKSALELISSFAHSLRKKGVEETPSFSSLPEIDLSKTSDVIKYIFSPPKREILVDGLGAKEMVSADELDHQRESRSVKSVSELLSDAMETSVRT